MDQYWNKQNQSRNPPFENCKESLTKKWWKRREIKSERYRNNWTTQRIEFKERWKVDRVEQKDWTQWKRN